MRLLRARAFGAVFFGVLAARADPPAAPSPFRTTMTGCPEEVTSRLPAIVELEIEVLLHERGPARAPPESVAFVCNEDSARIEVTAGVARRSSTLDLRGLAPEHRSRALALAAAELVHAMSGDARRAEPAPAAPPLSRETPAPPPPPPAPRAAAGPTLLLGGLFEILGRPSALLFGARLALVYPISEAVMPAITLDGAVGTAHAPSADVTVRATALAGHLYFGPTTGRTRWGVGPGASIGWVHLAGRPQDAGLEGATVAAAWGGPEIRGRVSYRPPAFARSPSLALELGGGLVALPVRGTLDGAQPVFAVNGAWASLSAELGMDL